MGDVTNNKTTYIAFRTPASKHMTTKFEILPETGDCNSVVFVQDDLKKAEIAGYDSMSDLSTMNDDASAMLAGSLFTSMYGIKVENQHCSEFDHDKSYWQGFVNEYHWKIETDGGDWLFSLAHDSEDF